MGLGGCCRYRCLLRWHGRCGCGGNRCCVYLVGGKLGGVVFALVVVLVAVMVIIACVMPVWLIVIVVGGVGRRGVREWHVWVSGVR